MMEKIPRQVGALIRPLRAGTGKILYFQKAAAGIPEIITVDSTSFKDGAPLDPCFTSDGAGISPQLEWHGVPQGTAVVVLLAEDADSPTLHPIVHVLLPDLPGADGQLKENAMGKKYRPPDPPTGHGPHQYFFQVYSLRSTPERPISSKGDLEGELKRKNCSGKGCLVGSYERK